MNLLFKLGMMAAMLLAAIAGNSQSKSYKIYESYGNEDGFSYFTFSKSMIDAIDLNLDDEEYAASDWASLFSRGERDFEDSDQCTWGGDAYCSQLVGRVVSGPLNLDHTLVVSGTAQSLISRLVDSGYDATKLIAEALSDHSGVYSIITV